MSQSPHYSFLPDTLPIRVPGLLISIIGFGILYWLHPVSPPYILASCLIGSLVTALTVARWAYHKHLGSLGFSIASIVVIALGYRFARDIAGYERASDNDLWVIGQFYTAAASVFFGTLCLLYKRVQADG